jgi:hypothetical protein
MINASEDIKKSLRGRPRTDTSPVMVRLSAAELALVDDFRRQLDDLPSRPEAIRRILKEKLGRDE